MKARLWKDKRGISVMQDAVLFCVMVSLSGAILMPAFTSNTIQKTYIEKENEEKANEVLQQLISCDLDKNEHLNAKPVLDSMGIDTNKGLLKPVIDTLLKREQLHRTYADLCTECIACQFKFLGNYVNIFAYDFTDVIRAELEKFLDERLRDYGYAYNFSIVWNPVVGFDFGGDIHVGDPIPQDANLYKASTYVIMPPSLITTGVGFAAENLKQYLIEGLELENKITDVKSGILSKDDFRIFFKDALLDIFDKTICDGFTMDEYGFNMESIVDLVVDYIFNAIKNSIDAAFDEALGMVSDVIARGTGKLFDAGSYDVIKANLASISETIGIQDSVDAMLSDVRTYIKNSAKEFIDNILSNPIEQFVDYIADNLKVISDPISEIINWFFQYVNFCRAEMSVVIWRA